jgi:hypothetical protein
VLKTLSLDPPFQARPSFSAFRRTPRPISHAYMDQPSPRLGGSFIGPLVGPPSLPTSICSPPLLWLPSPSAPPYDSTLTHSHPRSSISRCRPFPLAAVTFHLRPRPRLLLPLSFTLPNPPALLSSSNELHNHPRSSLRQRHPPCASSDDPVRVGHGSGLFLLDAYPLDPRNVRPGRNDGLLQSERSLSRHNLDSSRDRTELIHALQLARNSFLVNYLLLNGVLSVFSTLRYAPFHLPFII